MLDLLSVHLPDFQGVVHPTGDYSCAIHIEILKIQVNKTLAFEIFTSNIILL